MEISDIQIVKDKIEITFYDTGSIEDVLIIKISKKDAQQIAQFCQKYLSYGAQLRKEKVNH